MNKSWLGSILLKFIIWRAWLFSIAFVSISIFPVFGARFPYYQEYLIKTGLPFWIWGFGNFDGVHYLRIAIEGYKYDFTQVFFPLYPILIRIFSFNTNYFLSGFIISNILFVLTLLILYKLYHIDFKLSTVNKTLIFLLAFPTAFYFAAIYNESLLVLLIALSFFYLRKDNFLMSGIFAGLASATRVFGILLAPILLVEIYLKYRNIKGSKPQIKDLIGLLLSPIGLISYMIYLKINFNNSLYFLTAQSVFGAERSSIPIVILPQVIYRYIKILISVPVESLSFFNASLELLTTLFVILLLVITFKKIKLSYWLFSLGCLLLPTLTGTLSSMPRYALMSFLLFPMFIEKIGKYYWLVVVVFGILQAILLMMFIQGFWVA